MNTRQRFEHRWKRVRRMQCIFLWLWLALSVIGSIILGDFERTLAKMIDISNDLASLISVILLFAIWTLPPLFLFYLRARYDLTCPHCGIIQTPFKFPSYVLQFGQCPKCKSKFFDISNVSN